MPISLYISIEFVRTCQAAFIYFDFHMVHNDQAALARSWNLSDDLGQIEYIFSDKTGTLTQANLLCFVFIVVQLTFLSFIESHGVQEVFHRREDVQRRRH